MRIAIVNTVYSSSKSTGKLAYGLYSHLKNSGHTVFLYYGRKESSEDTLVKEDNIVRINSDVDNSIHWLLARILGNQGQYSKKATEKLINQLSENNVEAIYLMNLHGYYLNFPLLFSYIKERPLKCVYLMYDEYAFTGKCCFTFECNKYLEKCEKCPRRNDYPKSYLLDRSNSLFEMKRKAYNGLTDVVFVGVPYTAAKARNSALLRNKKVIDQDESIDLRNTFFPRTDLEEELRDEIGINKKKIAVLTVSYYPNERKGGKYFLECARTMEKNDKYVFIHVGFNGEKAECPSNYIPISYVNDQNRLAAFYSIADLFVCTSLAETVADTCLEALACGTPILGFDAAGMSDCADEEHGRFVEPGNVSQLVAEVSKTEKKNDLIVKSCRDYASARYDSFQYYTRLEKLLFE